MDVLLNCNSFFVWLDYTSNVIIIDYLCDIDDIAEC